MKNWFFLITLLGSSQLISYSQEIWSSVGTVEGSNIISRAVAHDGWGNTYFGGNIYNDAYFGTDTIIYEDDVFFIAKYDMNDSLLWAKTFGTYSYNSILDLECDDLGFIYITTTGSIEVTPGNYENAPMILKLDPYGNIIWYQLMQVVSGQIAHLELDENNNVYVGFSYQNTNLFAGVELVSVSSGTDAGIGKLDSDGNFQWVVGYDCLVSFGIGAYDLFYKEDYGLVISGKFADGSIAKKINPVNGAVLVSCPISSPVQDVEPYTLAINSNGEILVGGTFHPDIDFGGASIAAENVPDSFIALYSASGIFQWHHHMYGLGNSSKVKDIASDTSGNFFILGDFYLETIIGNDTIECIYYNSFMAKTDNLGNYLWTSTFGATAGTSGDVGVDVDWDNDMIYATGELSTTGLFGTITTTPNFTNDQAYILKGYDYGNILSGYYFLDYNNNSVKDGNDIDLVGKYISLDSNQVYTFTNDHGIFKTQVDTGSYTIKPYNIPLYHTLYPNEYLINYSTYNNSNTALDFRIVPIPNVSDLTIDLSSYNGLNPGFTSAYQLKFENVGTDTLSGSASLKFDPLLTLLYAELPPDYQTLDSLSWNFIDLKPSEQITILLNFEVSLASVLGDSMTFISTVLPILNDSTPANNQDILIREITGSYDPNNKVSNQGPFIDIDSLNNQLYFEYIIQFQNTGNDTAITVAIVDSIFNELDLATLELLGSSHPYSFYFTPPNRIIFIFNNIMLPDSATNQLASNGFIKFRIKPNSSLNVGDIITNTAYIYFDFNSPIITNTTVTEIVLDINLNEIESVYSTFGNIVIYPNPTSGVVYISFENDQDFVKVGVLDNMGRLLSVSSFESISGLVTINMNYPSGVYFIQIEDKNGHQIIQKCIKY